VIVFKKASVNTTPNILQGNSTVRSELHFRRFGTSAKMSGHFGHITLVTKCLGSKMSISH